MKLRLQGHDTSELYMFHGTNDENVDDILKNNFDLGKAQLGTYGTGIYFCRSPNVSLRFGRSLILCKVLLGRAQVADATDGKKHHLQTV